MPRTELDSILAETRYSRAWWLARARNALWVSVVTVLVWIYADVEFTDEMDLQAAIELTTPLDGKLVLLSESRIEVSFEVQGRRSDLEKLLRDLQTRETVIRHELSEGDTEISTRDILNAAEEIRDEGLTVLSASPTVVAVRLDKKIHIPGIPIQLNSTGAVIASEPQFQPETVGFHVAERDWQEILKTVDEPVLSTVNVRLEDVEPDKFFSVQLVPKLAGVDIELDQRSVQVKVQIAQLTERKEIAIPVQVVSPAGWLEDGTWQQYVLKRKDPSEWLAKIQVSGTRKDLDQLQPADVRAVVVLTDDDKQPVSWLTRQVDIRLPQELKLSLLSARPRVTFRLEKLPAAATP